MAFRDWLKNLFRPKNEEVISYEEFEKFLVQHQTDANAMNLSGVYACIDIISNTISKLPFFVMDRNTREHIDDEQLYYLLNYLPNEHTNATDFKKAAVVTLLTKGNCYIVPKFQGIKLQGLTLIDSGSVSVFRSPDDIVVYRYTDRKGVEHLYRYDEIIHLKLYSTDGINGISPLTYARLVTETGLNQENFQKQFYENGGRPSGTLTVAADLTGKKVEVIKPDGTKVQKSYKQIVREEWDKTKNGAYGTAVLDNGMKYETVPQISPADMDFVNSKTVNLEDIARFFNVPPYKLGVGKQTYSNNEQAQIDYITNCIVPIVNRFEQEFTLKLLLATQRQKNWVIKANLESELRGDTAARAAWYDKMRSMGIYNINEIRALENLPSIGEDGETRLIGANSVPLDRLINGDTAGSVTPNPLSNPDDPNKEDDDIQ